MHTCCQRASHIASTPLKGIGKVVQTDSVVEGTNRKNSRVDGKTPQIVLSNHASTGDARFRVTMTMKKQNSTVQLLFMAQAITYFINTSNNALTMR